METVENIQENGAQISLLAEDTNVVLVGISPRVIHRNSKGKLIIPVGLLVNQTVKVSSVTPEELLEKVFDSQPGVSPTKYIMTPVLDISVVGIEGKSFRMKICPLHIHNNK